MKHAEQWLVIRPAGLYCIPGKFYIDPVLPVDTAVITHGHSDHTCFGNRQVIATRETIAILKLRYGEHGALFWRSLTYHDSLRLGKVEIYFLPAGHILGSCQIVMVYAGIRIIFSGDYKRAFDPTCDRFQVESCNIFITEATFALPVFKHPPVEREVLKLLDSIDNNPTICHLVGVYALGKCQRLLKALRLLDFNEPIYLHGALSKLCNLYESLGISLGELIPASAIDKHNMAGKMILCPPSALQDRWSRRFPDAIKALASGWMQIRARAKQQGISLPLVISDHADWPELLQTIHDIHPGEIWITHGREDALLYYANLHGFKAKSLHFLGYEEAND